MPAADPFEWLAASEEVVFGRPSPTARRAWRLAPSTDGSLRSSATAGVRADGADTSWCGLRAASVVGIRHRLAGTASQDAWAWAADTCQVVLAVADGLGSLASSGSVAAAVVDAAVASAVAATGNGGDGATDELAAAMDAANRSAAALGGGASTLVLARIGRDGTVDLARVGDSTAFRLRDGVWTELFVDAEDGDGSEDVRSPATAALPASSPAIEVANEVLAAGDVLVLVSDGVGDPLRDGPTTVAPGLALGLAAPPHPLVLAAEADFSRQGCQDDRTIVGVWYSPGAV